MISGRCTAFKYLRRRCPSDCIFSPYFPPSDPQRFACVHRFCGAINGGKMLQQLPPHLRAQAAETLCFEAQYCRIQDPVYGCVGVISQLHEEIHLAESQLAKTKVEITFLNCTVPEARGLQIIEANLILNRLLLEQMTTVGLYSYGIPPSAQAS